MPPHSSTGASRGSRPWIMSQTNVPMTPTRRFRDINSCPTSCRSELAQRFHLERRNGSDDAGGEGKRTGNDAARFHRGLERAAPYFGAQRLEQRVTSLRDSTGKNDDVRVEDVEQVGNAGSEESRCLAHD